MVVSKAELSHVLHGPHTLVRVEQLAGGGEAAGNGGGYGMQASGWGALIRLLPGCCLAAAWLLPGCCHAS